MTPAFAEGWRKVSVARIRSRGKPEAGGKGSFGVRSSFGVGSEFGFSLTYAVATGSREAFRAEFGMRFHP